MKALFQTIDDYSISWKIGVIFSIPLLMMGYMAIAHLINEMDKLEKGERYIEMVHLIQRLDGVAHNMAIERGMSSGFIGDQNEARKAPLQQQRAVVDWKIEQLSSALALKPKMEITRFQQREIARLQNRLRQLDTVRIRVDHGGRSERLISDIFDYYSEINALALRIIGGFKDQVMELALIDQFNTLLTLLWIKERAGQERGRLNHYFSSGLLSSSAMVEINHYIHEQTLKLEEFGSHAKAPQKALYQREVRGESVDYVLQVRNTFLSRIKKQEHLAALQAQVGLGGKLHTFKSYQFEKTGPEYPQFLDFHDRVSELLFRYQNMDGVDAYELRLIAVVEEMVDDYYNAVERAVITGEREALGRVDASAAMEALEQISRYTKVDPGIWFGHASERINSINRVVAAVDRGLRVSVDHYLQQVRQQFAFYQIFVAVVVLAMLFALYFWGKLLRNIQSTVAMIRQIERFGDLSLRMPVKNRDEIGQIGDALNSLFGSQQQAIQEAIEVSLAVSEGAFDQRMAHTYRGDMERLKEGINGSAEQMEYYNRAKDDFLASMSHELRTPLTTIIGNSEFLAERLQDGEDREILHSIELAGRNQLALVNDILDMSKIESGKFTIDEMPYDLSQLMRDLQHMLSVRARDAGLEFLVTQHHQDPHLLVGDVARIGQILINLVGNAIKFTEEGRVELSSDVVGNYLVFKVEDSGIGMSPEKIDGLFRRFEQTDHSISRRFGGSGLGLYISENLAELMGGSIDCSSAEGRGSIFTLMLPYSPSDIEISQGGSNEEKSAHLSLLEQPLQGRVLVAEDTLELQLLERRILESMGLEVTTAENGEEAVRAVARNHFDLIMMDMQMPVMDGIQATRTLRRQGCKIPIIALTANVLQKHRDAFNQAGCNGFLGKPIDRQELRELLNHYLQPTAAAGQPQQMEEEVDVELMSIFLDSSRNNRDQLREALQQQAWERVRSVAHTIKGSAASFGYPALSRQAEEIQFTIDEGKLEGIAERVERLLQALDRLLQQAESILSSMEVR